MTRRSGGAGPAGEVRPVHRAWAAVNLLGWWLGWPGRL